MPRFTLGIIAGALVIQLVCALLNRWVKVSTHAAASGGVVGALLAFSLIFSFDPTGWLCLTVMLSGMVCTARLILRQHTLREIGWGVVIGFLSGFCCILLIRVPPRMRGRKPCVARWNCFPMRNDFEVV